MSHALLMVICTLLMSGVFVAGHARADAESNENPGEFDIPWVLPLDARERATLQALLQDDPQAAALLPDLRERAQALVGNPATPLEVIHYEGLVHTDPRRIETVQSLKQMGDAGWLLRYWQATEDPAAADTLRTWIAAWAGTYRFTGNDVNENKFVPLLIAYIDLRAGMTAEGRAAMDALTQQLGEHHARRAAESQHLTNRFAKHLLIAALAGLALERDDFLEAARQGVYRFVRESLRPDGTSFDLEHRDTLTYHGSALKPMIELSILFDRAADPDTPLNPTPLYFWAHDNGASIASSFNFVVPYAAGVKQREEWKNTQVELDRRRAQAGLAEYEAGKLYDPKQAAELLELAAHYRPGLVPLVAKLTDAPEDQARIPSWLILNHLAIHNAKTRP